MGDFIEFKGFYPLYQLLFQLLLEPQGLKEPNMRVTPLLQPMVLMGELLHLIMQLLLVELLVEKVVNEFNQTP